MQFSSTWKQTTKAQKESNFWDKHKETVEDKNISSLYIQTHNKHINPINTGRPLQQTLQIYKNRGKKPTNIW